MNLTIEEEARLKSAAEVAGLDPTGYVRSLLSNALPNETRAPVKGSAVVDELLREGVIGSGFGDRNQDAPAAARELRSRVWGTTNVDPAA